MIWEILALYVAYSVISLAALLFNLDILYEIVLNPDVPKIGKVIGVWLMTVVVALSVIVCRLIWYFYGG